MQSATARTPTITPVPIAAMINSFKLPGRLFIVSVVCRTGRQLASANFPERLPTGAGVARCHQRCLANAETDVADDFAAKTPLQFAQDVDLADLFQLVMQCRLEHPHIEHAFT